MQSELKTETEVSNANRVIINALKKECFAYCNYHFMFLEEKEDRFNFIWDKKIELSLRYTFENQNLLVVLILPIEKSPNCYNNPIMYNVVSGIKLNSIEGEALKFVDNIISLVKLIPIGKKMSTRTKKHLLIEISALVAMRRYYEKLLENETRHFFNLMLN